MGACRVCLSKDRDMYHSLFSIHEDRTIAKTIMLCTGVKIKLNDGLTQLVCGVCTDEFHNFFKLRQQCIEADFLLRKNLESSRDDNNQSHELDRENSQIEDYEIEVLDMEFDPHCDSPDNLVASPHNERLCNDVKIENDISEVLEDVNSVEQVVAVSDIKPEESLQTRRSKRTLVTSIRRKGRKILTLDRSSRSKFICCSCPSEEFESLMELELHRADQHEKYRIADNVIRPHECDVCFQRFLTEKHLQLHKSRPYKKREYVCTSCGNAFLANNTLKKHEEICVGPCRNYSCQECGKRFTQVGSLNNHMMLHNSEKTHSCPICAKRFLKKFEVSIHMVTHTEEQPFPCDQCPARFKRKQALRNHQKHHSNPTPYKCDLCDEWFNNFSARKYHRQKVHDGIEPFQCDQCGASYGRKNRLEQHVKRMHAE